MIKKYRVGCIQRKKDGSGNTIKVGSPESKNEKFRNHVHITVTDDAGNVLAKATNGYLQAVNPRTALNGDKSAKTEEQIARIPEYILAELFLIVDDAAA